MSYTSTQFLLYDVSSTANFDAMGTAIHNAIAAMGWTQTSDTGQVNWGSNPAYPSAGNSVYEIWQPADALQTGSTKFYMRVDYADITNIGAFSLVITLCTSTNGAGVPAGSWTRPVNFGGQDFSGSSNQGTATSDCYFSGDVDRCGMLLWRSFGGRIGGGFTIERTKNVDGTNSSDGVCIYTFGYGEYSSNAATLPASFISGNNHSSMNTFQQVLLFTAPGTSQPFASGQNAFFNIDDGNTGATLFNGSIAMTPIFPNYGKIGNPNTTLGYIRQNDVGEAVFFSTTLYGATRAYIATSNLSGTSGANGHQRLCLRYD